MKKITLVYVLDITVLPRQLFQDNVWLIYYRRLIFQYFLRYAKIKWLPFTIQVITDMFTSRCIGVVV